MDLTPWHPLIGLGATLLLGRCTKVLVNRTKEVCHLEPPNEQTRVAWDKVTSGDEGGAMLGHLERLLFFGCFWLGADIAIGGWLAFKVGAKWQAWTNVIAVPKELKDVDILDYLNARRRWGSRLLMSFQVGTLANLLVGFAGMVVGKHGETFVRAVVW